MLYALMISPLRESKEVARMSTVCPSTIRLPLPSRTVSLVSLPAPLGQSTVTVTGEPNLPFGVTEHAFAPPFEQEARPAHTRARHSPEAVFLIAPFYP